ncbi:MAG: hypothetical protein VKJ24_16205 [Synechococcales bacterium]|nr:hypothetical protein [Synechococcales bacterium]
MPASSLASATPTTSLTTQPPVAQLSVPSAQASKLPLRFKRHSFARKRFAPPANRPPMATRGSGTR